MPSVKQNWLRNDGSVNRTLMFYYCDKLSQEDAIKDSISEASAIASLN